MHRAAGVGLPLSEGRRAQVIEPDGRSRSSDRAVGRAPNNFSDPRWNGALAAPSLGDVNQDGNLDVVLQTWLPGRVAYTLIILKALREEQDGLRRGREKVFQAPPVEWIEERLARVQELLERRTDRSALLLRSLLGEIRLEPTRGQIGRPYYVARTALDTLALLAPLPGQEGPEAGSNPLRWWRRWESNPRPRMVCDGLLHA